MATMTRITQSEPQKETFILSVGEECFTLNMIPESSGVISSKECSLSHQFEEAFAGKESVKEMAEHVSTLELDSDMFDRFRALEALKAWEKDVLGIKKEEEWEDDAL